MKNGEWKSRTNRELEEMSKGENIVKWIKWQSISWLGHLQRMEEDRKPKNICTQELEWTRRRGRPRKGWKEQVERDLQVLEVRRWENWWQIGRNGRTFFDRPNPTMGCSANGRRRRHDKDGFLSLNLTIHLHGTVQHMITRWTYLGYIHLLTNRQHWKLKVWRGKKVSASCDNKPAIPHAVHYPLKFNVVLFPVWNYSWNKNWTV